MTALFRVWLLIEIATTLLARAPQTRAGIQIWVYNYARVPAETLARAERKASWIFRDARVPIEWIDCPLSPDEVLQHLACLAPASPTRLALRILPEDMAGKLGLEGTAAGSVIVPQDGQFGTFAQVRWRVVQGVARRLRVVESQILGQVMAHEIGHLLLGIERHSETGLMQAHWDLPDVRQLLQGTLLFTPREAQDLRRAIALRQAAEAQTICLASRW